MGQMIQKIMDILAHLADTAYSMPDICTENQMIAFLVEEQAGSGRADSLLTGS